MTESVRGRLHLDLLLGVYGSLVLVIDCPSAIAEGIYTRQQSLGSSGETDGDVFSTHRTPAQALRAFADRLDELFEYGEQTRALIEWQMGSITSYAELIAKYGRKR